MRHDRDDKVPDQIIGATRLAFLYGKSRKWASRMLAMSHDEDRAKGTIPPRVFVGPRGALYTTMAALETFMPKGKDLALLAALKVKDTDDTSNEDDTDEEEDD